jgi:ribonucleotide monophosphatase NagD (HAD superfamily)
LPAADVAMVGDRLLTDVAMARRAGMVAVLVLTGATSRDDLAASGTIQPDLVVDDLAQLIERVS